MAQYIMKKPNSDIKATKMPYLTIHQNKLATLFKWKSDDVELPYNMELLIRKNGSIGYYKEKNLWVIGAYNGIKDDLNRFKTYVCKTLATTPQTFELSRDDVVVCGNNPLFASDFPIIEFDSMMKEETDVSIYYQLINSRNIPAIIAENDKQKTAIEKAYENIKAGKPVVITTSLLEELNTLDLTDKEAIAKMQYLSSFYDVLEKRNAGCFGVDLPLVDKRAQVNENEMTNFDDVTSLSFLAAYESRLLFCEEMEKRFGIKIECVRNPIYKDEADKEEIESEEAQEESLEEMKEETKEEPEDGKEGGNDEENS